MEKPEIKAKLETGIATVVFNKADGSIRTMKCTLQPSYLPPKVETNGPTKFNNPEVVAVWDIDNSAWRSFRIDSIKEISFS